MGKAAIDITRLTRDEKLDLLDDLWTDLGRDPDALPLSDAQREDLDRRLDELEAEGPVGVSWEEAVRQIRLRELSLDGGGREVGGIVIHPSDSSEQKHLEGVLLGILSRELCLPLVPAEIPLGSGVRVAVDGLNLEAQVICEVYAHIGILKGGQKHKIAKDTLKLIHIERVLGGRWRKLLCFVDEAAARHAKGSSWLAAACRALSVRIVVIRAPDEFRTWLEAVQKRQVMMNPLQPTTLHT